MLLPALSISGQLARSGQRVWRESERRAQRATQTPRRVQMCGTGAGGQAAWCERRIASLGGGDVSVRACMRSCVRACDRACVHAI
eukprot:6179111-Pleurochrysis_carterae.AAC.2